MIEPRPDAMTAMTIDKKFFENRKQVMADIAKTGFWPTTFISNRSPELPVHHHDHDIIGYVIEGETYLLDADERKIVIACRKFKLRFLHHR